MISASLTPENTGHNYQDHIGASTQFTAPGTGDGGAGRKIPEETRELVTRLLRSYERLQLAAYRMGVLEGQVEKYKRNRAESGQVIALKPHKPCVDLISPGFPASSRHHAGNSGFVPDSLPEAGNIGLVSDNSLEPSRQRELLARAGLSATEPERTSGQNWWSDFWNMLLGGKPEKPRGQARKVDLSGNNYYQAIRRRARLPALSTRADD